MNFHVCDTFKIKLGISWPGLMFEARIMRATTRTRSAGASRSYSRFGAVCAPLAHRSFSALHVVKRRLLMRMMMVAAAV